MQYMNIVFVCNEELKGGMQGYSICLLGNQLKFQLQPFGCKRARTYNVITIVGTLVRFEVGQSCYIPLGTALNGNNSLPRGANSFL